MRFICKNCGARSPHGIGYVGPNDGPLPEPDPDCPNPHERVEELRRIVASVTKPTEYEETQP